MHIGIGLKKNLLIIFAFVFFWGVILFVYIRKEHVYAFNIYGLSLSKQDTLTIGSEDNIIFNSPSIPANAIKISKATDYKFNFSVKPNLYLKFNDTTLNKYILQDGDELIYKEKTLSYTELIKITNPYIGYQKYFLLSSLIDDKDGQFKKINASIDSCKSLIFFDSKKKNYSLIILDTSVVLKRGDNNIHIQLVGAILSKNLKIEIIDVAKTLFIADKKPFFHNININVATVRTEWQASHIFLKSDSSGQFSALFSQPLMIAFNDSVIAQITRHNNSRTVLFAQESDNIDLRTFYFARFSNLSQLPIATLIKSDSAKFGDKIIFAVRDRDHGEVKLETRPLKSTTNFQIVSSANRDIEINGKFIYLSKMGLLLPFVALLVIFLFSFISIYILVNPEKGVYHRAISNNGTYIDFEYIDNDDFAYNKTLWYLRYPVFVTVFILTICKLIIAIKLSLTYPFFPQFMFIGTSMAFTTPLFVSYFWLRNSWHFNDRKKFWPKHFINLALLFSVICVGYFCWHYYGRDFYKNYLYSYGLSDNLEMVFGDFIRHISSIFYHKAGKTIYAQKYLQIPIFITLIPIIFIFIDLGRDIPRIWRKSPYKKEKPFKKPNWFLLLLWSNVNLLVFFILGSVISKKHALTHLIAIAALYCLFKFLKGFMDLHQSKKQQSNFDSGVVLKFLFAFIFYAVLVVILPLIFGDTGYFINYVLVIPFVVFHTLIIYYSKLFDNEGKWLKIIPHWIFRRIIIPIAPVVVIFSCIYLYYIFASPRITDMERSERRVNSIILKNAALSTGGKQYLSDIQFLEIAQINSIESIKKPSFKLVNREKPFHDFISKGLYPVIINDLNPLVLLDYGGGAILFILLITWLFLLLNRRSIWFANFDINESTFNENTFNTLQLLRYVPALIIVGNSLWLFLSLLNIVFFTGRIVNGFGVESFVDWMELIVFASFMGLVMFNNVKLEKGR